MTELKTFAEAEAALLKYMPLAHEIIGKDITLDRMWPLMAILGNPEQKIKVVHIAGTSGKTSTAYYVASLLQAAGKKVGLTVSPHMDSIAERVQVNLTPLSEKVFCKQLSNFLTILSRATLKPTYYEVLIAFAYWYFYRAGMDYAVIETGLGGLHDGSNVANRPDKVCIITDIGYDHLHVLGRTLPQISRQKAGIIHAGNYALMFHQADEVLDVVHGWCANKKASLEVCEEPAIKKLLPATAIDDLPQFKQRNWLLAYAAYRHLQQIDKLPNLTKKDLNKSLQTYIPGRMDEVLVDGKKVIMDGAHNGQKMQAFVGSYLTKYPGVKATVLLAVKQSKEYGDVLAALKPIASQLLVTDFTICQDGATNGVDPATLAKAAQKLGFLQVTQEPNQAKAYEHALSKLPEDGVLIITGSLYLLSQLRHAHPELLCSLILNS